MRGTLGFVGLGTMGDPMAAALRRAGIDVVGWDTRPDALQRACDEHGLRPAASARDLAAQSAVVITMLPTSAHVETALFGAEGLAPGLQRSALVIDMTSGVPSRTREFGKRLAVQGVALCDAPVSGSVTRARSADLAIMLGGDDDAADRAEPWLQPMARTVFRTGALGTGQAMKALNNLASAAGYWIASEVLTIGCKAGLQPQTMLDVLNASTGQNYSTQHKFQQQVLSGRYAGNFLLALMVKDLGIADDLAGEVSAHATMTRQVLQHWRDALKALGEQADHTEVARLVSHRGGTRLS